MRRIWIRTRASVDYYIVDDSPWTGRKHYMLVKVSEGGCSESCIAG